MNVDRSDSLDADDAFSLLGNETRLGIIRALGDAWAPDDRDPIPFSELRRRVGTRDSGRFDYHLDQLRGLYVTRSDDGYRLTYPGVRVYQAIQAGTFNERPTIDSLELDSPCLDCGGRLVGSYEDLLFDVTCEACGYQYCHYYLPPGQVIETGPAAVLGTLDQAVRRDTAKAAVGVCPECTGHTDVAVGPDVGYIFEKKDSPFEGHVSYDCSLCGAHLESTVGSALTDHPAIVSFFYERGIDVTDQYLWTLPFAHDPARTTVRSTDPLRVAVTAAADGDEATLVVDDALSVVAVE
jgi:DNA-binding transcriptional ArsR family regulator